MNHTKRTEAEAAPASADRPARMTVGMLIVLGGGLGLVVGLLLGDMLLGMLSGAGIGILIDALSEMGRRPVARAKGTNMDPKSIQRFSTWGTGIAVGILLGTAVGVALNSIAIGVIFGLMLGTALEIFLRRPVADQAPPHSDRRSRSEQPEDAPAPAHMRNEERPR